MTMLSLAPKTLSLSLSSPFLARHPLPFCPCIPYTHSHSPSLPKPILAIILPPNSPQERQQQLYQPFRPPPSPLPTKFRSLDTSARLDVLANRLGLWFEYAPLIPSLTQEGFSPSTIEELTGISGVQQNILVVASKVRESLVQSKINPEILGFFDTGGAELLYEIRLLSAAQRTAAVQYLVENKFDSKGAQELARSMKDFPRRRGDKGWDCFNYNLPGDCLAFMLYRQALEHDSVETRKTFLEKALQMVESEEGKKKILETLEGKTEEERNKAGAEDRARVPVVRMQIGELAEASTVVVLPVCRAEDREKELVEAPWECKGKGEFGVVETEKGWNRWVVLPGWEPVVGLKRGGVVVAFADARVLPWRVNRWYKEEAILVVADRGRNEVVADDGFYLVVGNGNGNGGADGLKVERGKALKEMEVKESLGTVVLVVRPPREETDNQLSDEDWE